MVEVRLAWEELGLAAGCICGVRESCIILENKETPKRESL
jgi:hypothetical protein